MAQLVEIIRHPPAGPLEFELADGRVLTIEVGEYEMRLLDVQAEYRVVSPMGPYYEPADKFLIPGDSYTFRTRVRLRFHRPAQEATMEQQQAENVGQNPTPPAPPRINPTIGRKLYYWPDDHLAGQQPHDATIVFVHSDSCINLACHDYNGNPYPKTSVPLVQEGEPTPDYGYATWMPFQVGQARAAS